MSEIDVKRLSRSIKRKLETDGLNQNEAAAETGVAATTFGRMVHGLRKPDFANFMSVCRWLGQPPETFMRGEVVGKIVVYPDQDSISFVTTVITNDPNIPEWEKPKLIEIFAAAYRIFGRNGK